MSERKVAPYGGWKSPIASDLITSDFLGLGWIVIDGDDIYWNELRRAEDGRNVIVRRGSDGQIADITPPGFSARDTVHEYGGAFAVDRGTVYFAFEGEQHGFRKAENIKRALDAEFHFFARVFGYEPADRIEPVPIENL